MPNSISTNFLESIHQLFRYYKSLGDKAMEQLSEDQFHQRANEASNTIAIIVKHISGNMLSRWTNFLESDGEKEWRHRESEFEDDLQTKADVLAAWNKGWDCLFYAIDPLTPDDLERIIYIRNEGHTVLEAIHRQLAHYSSHIGQIIYLAKSLKSDEWISLSIPKGQSKNFNQQKFSQEKRRKHFT